MNKSELIESLSEETKLTKKKAEEVVELFFAEISNALARGERVEIRGFCSLFTKNHKSYIGKNPKTGERILVSAKKSPFFKCGKELKERVDYPRSDENTERVVNLGDSNEVAMRLQVLDTLGLKCPEPLIKVAVKAVDMRPGDILEVLGDCPTFEKDLRVWCERLGKLILSIKEDGVDKKTIQIGF